jgi:hypothetical protein
VTNQLVLERELADPNFPTYDLDNVYGNLSGIDSQGYYYHAADISSIYMRLVKRHPDTLAVVAVTNPRAYPSASTGPCTGTRSSLIAVAWFMTPI